MKQRELAEALRDIRVFNNWDLLMKFSGSDDVAVDYHRPDYRSVRACATNVWSPRQHDKLNAPKALSKTWNKSFTGKRSESLPLALDFVQNELGIEIAASPFGGYIPKRVRLAATKAVEPKEELDVD